MVAAITGRCFARRNSRSERRETRSVSNDSFSSLTIASRSPGRASRTTMPLWRQLLMSERTGPHVAPPRCGPVLALDGPGAYNGWRLIAPPLSGAFFAIAAHGTKGRARVLDMNPCEYESSTEWKWRLPGVYRGEIRRLEERTC